MSGLKKIVIVGASGNTGSSILKHLLAINKTISITIVSRDSSKATFPSSPQITLKKGSYSDASFLETAFQGSELAAFCLAHSGEQDQPKLIEAAAKAGVKYIVPNEYSLDGLSKPAADHPIVKGKVATRELVKEKGMKFISPVTGPWTELSITWGLFGIDVRNRRATLYNDAGENNTASIGQVGLTIAKVLSLPVTSQDNPRASVEHYANNFIYISSFCTTQGKIFEAVKKATSTSDADWEIKHSTISKLANADMMSQLYSFYMGDGRGGNFDAKATEDRKTLGIEEEDLDEVVKGALTPA
ncbi:hypothetical protein PRZ48_001110 [Zasmidium cellare]|uniref:NmrA-like domain-containing protein n=1 Tax=Zasmidium cellare TaxID=395010 RepID=A0ABR0F262_ZASCE|nr:hypothetical protein PRZ48_001110 [Zasmidium cellare]